MKLPALILPLLSFTFAIADDRPAAIPLWPHGAPGSGAQAAEPEKMDGSNVLNVHNPSITPLVPEKDATGIAVIITPGGGHSQGAAI